jgi:16S rRNA G966 N2-methylase RsmD
MSQNVTSKPTSPYTTWFLLSEQKRNDVLELWEVQQYGRDSFGDPDYVSIYGMLPRHWFRQGVRLLGRTVVECTRDRLADQIGGDVASVVEYAGRITGSVVVDPCAGSCNTLFWIQRHLAAEQAIGFEIDEDVFATTRKNLFVCGLDVKLVHERHEIGLPRLRLQKDQLLVVFISPPWGRTVSRTSGLDLRRTTPPVSDIVDLVSKLFPRNKLLFAVELLEAFDQDSVAEVTKRFDWSKLRIYDIDAAGRNHGVLLGSRSWMPSDDVVLSDTVASQCVPAPSSGCPPAHFLSHGPGSV